jgi:hypothetical protein
MGDVVDGWRVLGMEPNERLTLSMLTLGPPRSMRPAPCLLIPASGRNVPG